MMINNTLKHILQRTSLTAIALAMVGTAATVAPDKAHALPASYYASMSALARGHWVKIRVHETGVYSISYEQLRKWGFSNPAQVGVYGANILSLNRHSFDEKIPDDLPLMASYSDDEHQRIFFFAVGDHYAIPKSDAEHTYSIANMNLYSDGSYYFLHDTGAPIPELPKVALGSGGTRVERNTHTALQMQKRVQFNPGSASVFSYGEQMFPGGATPSYQFDYKDWASGTIYTRWQFAGQTWDDNVHLNVTSTMDATLGNVSQNTIPSLNLSSQQNKFYSTNTGYLQQKPNTANPGKTTYTFSLQANASDNWAALDYVYTMFTRNNTLVDNPQQLMAFSALANSSNRHDAYVQGGSSDVTVWNVTDPNDVRRHDIGLSLTTGTVKFTLSSTLTTDNGVGVYAVFDRTKDQLAPEYVSTVQNQSLHSLQTPEVLVIATKAYAQYAEELADLHRQYLGQDVLVAYQDEIVNEFSYGTPHIMALRRFVKMLYDRDPSQLKAVILYGVSTYDTTGKMGMDPDRYVYTYQVDHPDYSRDDGMNYANDSYFVMLDDKYSHSNVMLTPLTLPIGRILADTDEDATQYNMKVKDYLENPPSADNYLNTMLTSGDGDNYAHLRQGEAAAEMLLENRPEMTVYRSFLDLVDWKNMEEEVTERMGRRLGYFAYNGHGGSGGFVGYKKEFYYTHNHVPGQMSTFTTCGAMPFDQISGRSWLYISKLITMRRNMGMMANVAACRSVYLDYNHYISYNMAEQWSRADSQTMLGHIFQRARNAILRSGSSSTYLGVNSLCYNFAGDPALPVYAPDYKVVFTSINGRTVTDGTEQGSIKAEPLQPIPVEGEIVDANGRLMSDFNGKVVITLYEGPQHVKVEYDRNGEMVNVADYDEDEEYISKFGCAVVDGKFSGQIIASEAMSPAEYNRLTGAADKDGDYYSKAVGMTHALCVAQYSSTNSTDTEGPVISSMYVNDDTFIDGGDVQGPTITLFATIEADPSGIVTGGSAVGGTRLMLDGNRSLSQVRSAMQPQADGSCTLEMVIGNILTGRHTLTLTVYDKVGNPSTYDITFNVVDRQVAQPIKVDFATTHDTDNDAARTTVRFTCQASNYDDDQALRTASGRIVIEDIDGNMVAVATIAPGKAFQLDWDLKDLVGERVPDGRYRAIPLLHTAEGANVVAQPVQFYVVK